MVSKNPNSADGFYLDPTGMALPGTGPFATMATAASAASSSDDSSKKIRKPYTITKSRETWTEPEHDKFLEALQLFDRDWKKIEAFISSKTVIQIRSHAQKYFLKVQKNGTSEHLPPPRPKRKAAHPYPQKASKTAHVHPQVSGPLQLSTALLDTGYALRSEPSSMLMDPTTSAAPSSWTSKEQTINFSQAKNGLGLANKSCSSSEATPKTRQNEEITDQRNHGHALRVLPDFVQVYSFIGSVFDPKATGHLQKLKKMDPIDVETILLLMRNLSINLTNPDFEDHTDNLVKGVIPLNFLAASLMLWQKGGNLARCCVSMYSVGGFEKRKQLSPIQL
ncbi:hypothetical protein V6N12_037739 [Hibiscus sabdariffa]|uniref:MYB transcription factor n=1 Tax=Hibiscus sabdariffa TaxID=183260 RepID=A0ABR2C280_9ROSI